MRRSLAVVCALAVAPAPATQDAPRAVDATRFALRAVDPDGRPLEGVSVAKLDSAAHVVGAELARSGADGHLDVTLEVPRSSDYESFAPLVLVLARAGRASVAVPAATFPMQHWGRGPRVELGDVPMPSGVTLRGVVRDQAGAPLADVVVEAIDAMRTVVHGVGDDEALTPFLLVATPYSLARSDANGRFELRGALPAGACVVATKPGHATSIASPVAVGDRLQLTMAATGFARGVVVDREGNGVAEYLALIDEFGNETAARSEADGRFELTLPSRGRWTVVSIRERMLGDDGRTPDESWQRGTRDELRVAAHQRKDGAAALVVRVLDDAGGKPIDGALVGVGWHEFFQEMIASSATATAFVPTTTAARNGEASLDGPREGEDLEGVVVATAPGHAPQHAPIEWSESGARVELRLSAEAVLRGIVVDEASGEPIAGALVEVAAPSAAGAFAGVLAFQSGYAPASDKSLSASGGRFELRGLAAGSFELRATLLGRPDSASVKIEVTAGEVRDEVRLAIPSGRTLRGRLRTNEATPSGVWLEARPIDEALERFVMTPFAFDQRAEHACRVGPDGAFELRGLAPGEWRIVARGPSPQTGVSTVEVPLATVTIAGEDVARDFDAPAFARAKIAGTITAKDAAIRLSRLGVHAVRVTEEAAGLEALIASGMPGATGTPASPVDRGGRFELAVDAGTWRLVVVDLLTNVELESTDEFECAAGSAVTKDLALDCGAVRVRFTGFTDDDSLAGRKLFVASASDDRPAGGPMSSGPFRSIRLDPSSRELLVILPLEAMRLGLSADVGGDAGTRVSAKAGETVELEIPAGSK